MRIVRLANFVAPRSGGLRTAMRALGEGYLAAGYEPVLVVPGPSYLDEQTRQGRVIALPGPVVPLSGGYRVLVDRRRLTALLTELAPDRLEVSDRTTLRWTGAWARRHGVPAVMVSHESVAGLLGLAGRVLSGPPAALADTLNSRTARHYTRVVCTTAWAAARARGVPAVLVVVGDGPLRARLVRRAAGLPVAFTGFVPDRVAVAGLLATADVVLAPGPVETFGLAALEALACGTPVVVSAGSALPEVVGAAGVAVPGEDFAAGVARVLERPVNARRAAARRRAEEFGWPAAVRGFLAAHELPVPVPR